MRILLLTLPLAAAPWAASADTPAQIASGYAARAGAAPSAERGRLFFVTPQQGRWSCASCHGEPPVGVGRHAATGKALEPLAPAANAARLADPAKVDKWLRRNCNDVAGRDCTPQEKADVLHWLATLPARGGER